MKLRFILGIAGSGKTETCLKEISEKIKNTSKTLIYVVPEQFTLQSEKSLAEKFSSNTILNIQILSFKRLAYQLFSETGVSSKKSLEDTGKLMLIRKIILELSSKITYFNKSIDKDGFLDDISSSISEFFQYSITPELLEKNIENFREKENLYAKMKDLLLIYKEYLNKLKNEYISSDETLDILAEKISESKFIENSEIWIDGFNGFTPQEYKVIAELFKKTDQINIALCINSKSSRFKDLNAFDPFFDTKSTVNKLNKLASETGVKILPPLFLKDNMRQKNCSELIFLNQNYLKYTKNIYALPAENITITNTKNKYSEINMAASEILKLVRDNNYSYKDIGIILGDEEYENPLKSIFNQYGIPYFIDAKKDINSNRITALICSFLDIFSTNWSYEAVFRFLKTGLTPLEESEINILENYVLAYGIKGKRWTYAHWDYGFDNTSEFDENDINYIKDCFVQSLEPFTLFIKPNKKYTVKEISEKLYNLLISLDIDKTINEMESSEYIQVYNIIMNLLDKITEILGEQKVTIKEYSKILNSGLSCCKTGFLPAAQDEIIIGTLKRTRLPEIKALFILSVNEGVLPSFMDENGIFSDSEKEFLKLKGITLSPSSDEKINQDKFLLYTMFSKPSCKLYVSYRTGDLDGKSKRPSQVIHRIKSLFPAIKEKNDDLPPLDKITLPYPSFEALIQPLANYSIGIEPDDTYKDLYTWFAESDKFSAKLKTMEKGLFEDNIENYITPESAKKLYGKEINSSVSKLEQFARCPFSFFVQYGLKAKERKLYQITPPDLGNIFHKVLEEFSKYLKKNKINWRELDKQHTEILIDGTIDEIIPTISNEVMLSTAKYKHLVQNIKRVTKRSVNVLSEHIKAGTFEPLGYEIGFGSKEKLPPIIIELSDNSKLILTGKIDRIDVLDSDGNTFVKIIDYKSGTKKYNLIDVYYGIQLQLILYLDSFIKKGQSIVNGTPLAGGMFYFIIDDPMITVTKEMSAEEAEQEILKAFKMSGLVLDNPKVTSAMDNEAGYSKIIPVRTLKDGGISKSQSVAASEEEFNALRLYITSIVKEIGDEIIKGNIKAYPFKKGTLTACDYCIYKSICLFETINKENKYRKINSFKNPLEKIIESDPSQPHLQ